MNKDRVRELIAEKLHDRMERMEMKAADLKKTTDLVRTGLLNSMEFVEMVADLEDELDVRLDYDVELDKEGFTTLGGLVNTFKKYLDAKA